MCNAIYICPQAALLFGAVVFRLAFTIRFGTFASGTDAFHFQVLCMFASHVSSTVGERVVPISYEKVVPNVGHAF